jgi:hypothetical protein
MDSFSSGAVGASSIVVLGILYKIYQAINHKHLRSRCCNKEFDASIDIDDSTPKTNPVIVRDGTADRADPQRNEQENRPPT